MSLVLLLVVPLLVQALAGGVALAGSGAKARVGSVAKKVSTSAARTTPVQVAPLGERVRFGAYVDGMVASPSRFSAYESQVGGRMDVASYFYGFGDEFPAAIERGFADGGRRDVLLSWDMGPTRFTDWSSGKHDAYLRTIAGHASRYPYTVYVRPWPEMNGDWQDFQPTAAGSKRYGGTPAEFVAAWRHVVDVVRGSGGRNVKWVFNPSADTYAETTDVRTIWPGTGYVDVLGLDGYNWGNGGVFRWREFTDVFAAQYSRLAALHPTAPVWICEYGSKEPTRADGAPIDASHSKGQWMQNLLATRSFPRVTTLVGFDVLKERDWRASSSSGALTALRGAVAARARR